ncbi:MAG: hypothetical protein IK148_01880 [Prevotella sp.]|jgi:hypothetical protein|nr:hypothetical protein [Prevotella sp.]
MMNKKYYQKPAIKVVSLLHRTQLLAGSITGAARNSYGNANPSVAADELNNIGQWEWK